jgi:hypothetical protein
MRALAAAATIAVTTVLTVGLGTAHAHDPVILEPEQSTPEAGPLLVDGTVSFALYGTVYNQGDTRGFRVRYAAGQTFNLSALVPNLEPEQALPVDQYPTITVVTPSGERIDLQPGEVSTFDEPFTKTSYRRYLEWSTVAEAGDYGVIVTGVAPARFTVSTGVKEQFGTAVENIANRDLGVAGVMEWYATPPPAEEVAPDTTAAATTAPPDTTAITIDLAPTAGDTTPESTAPPPETTVATTADEDDGGQGVSGILLVVAVLALIAIAAGAVAVIARRRDPNA